MTNLQEHCILIVEDDTNVREAIAFDFIRKGFTVLQAESVATAMTILTTQNVDLVISDMQMPGGTGLELIEQANAVLLELPHFAIVSGWFSDQLKEELTKRNIATFPKPFDREELMSYALKTLKVELPESMT